MPSSTGLGVCTSAALEIGVLAAGETLKPGEAAVFMGLLNRLIDNWNAEREAIYATDFLAFTFVPGLNPHTIGPTGVWVVDQRPVTIEGANVVLTPGSNQVNAPQIRMHDQSVGVPRWFQSLATPKLTTSYPTDGYYDATWPDGSLYLWPVPSTAYGCQIQVRSVLSEFTLATTVSMPPGYLDAMILTLAEMSSRQFGRAVDPDLTHRGLVSRLRIFGNNTGGGQIVTQDSGMPGRFSKRSNWNYLTGLLTGNGR